VPRRLSLIASTPLLLLGLAACGSGSVSADQAAESAEDILEEQVGIRPEVACSEALEAEVGATARCTLTAGDDPSEYGVTLTVTSVDGDDMKFDIEVDDEPLD
jgi:hypothetical protein